MISLEKSGAAQEWEVRRTKLQRDATAAALESAESQKRLAEENVKLEQTRIERYELRAPFGGTIVRIDTESGATLTSRDPMLTLFAFDPLEAVMFLPVDLYGEMEMGKDYRFAAEAPVDRELTGKLKTIEAVIDSASRTFRCVFTLQNSDHKLPAGFTLRLIWPQVK
jgi:multidrug efflux pump subunit AcrA (membrane-fusion protein)